MCLDGNSANHAVHYINGQLAALYENAVECVAQNGSSLKAHERLRFDFALAEFYVAPKYRNKVVAAADMMFSATFDNPRLEFICNHEVILHLRIHEGHFNLDHGRFSEPGFLPSRERNVSISELDIKLRMEFDIRGQTAKIGNDVRLIEWIVLDFSSAHVISDIHVHGGRDALASYLRIYMKYLHEAGHHILYSLPNFYNDRKSLMIDYSLEYIPVHLDLEVLDIHGVSVKKIDEYLSFAWLRAAILVEKFAENDYIGVDDHAICMAEYRSSWTNLDEYSDMPFHIKFGPMRIKALCKREAVLYFKIDEVNFYDDDDDCTRAINPRHSFQELEIAVIIGISHEKNAEGVVTVIKFDFSTIRFCDNLSTYDNMGETSEICRTLLISFLENYYISLLEGASCHVIYTVDIRPLRVDDGSVSDSDAENDESPEVGRPGEVLIEKTRMFGFDYVQAISQTSITEHFKNLWTTARSSTDGHTTCLAKWSHEHFFEANFGALTLRLLSNGKAIIWVHLEDGTIRTPKNRLPLVGDKPHPFMDWHLAFEVDLKMYEEEDLVKKCDTWLSRYKSSSAGRKYHEHPAVVLKHLCLDLTNADFVYELSTFDGLFSTGPRGAIDLVQAAIQYIRRFYLPTLAEHGHHILFTIPVWRAGSAAPAYALTNVKHQIYSRFHYDRRNCKRVTRSLGAVIVFLGMCGFRERPSGHLDYSTEWIVRDRGFSYGTLCLSRKLFIEERLLTLLSRVNAITTVVPAFAGVEDGQWKLHLTTLAEHAYRSDKCVWQPGQASHDSLDYKWEHRDDWNYEHEGTASRSSNGGYYVFCRTRNDLHIPTAYRHGLLEVKVKGEVTLERGFKDEKVSWSSKATAKWSAVVSLVSENGGMSIKVSGETRPVISVKHVNHELIAPSLATLDTLLKAQLPTKIEFTELSKELQHSFCGESQFCYPGMNAYALYNPVFNRQGDILFEVRPYSHSAPRSRLSTNHLSRSVSRASSRAPSVSLSSSKAFVRTLSQPDIFLTPTKDVDSRLTTPEHSSMFETGKIANGNGHANGSNGHANGSNGHVVDAEEAIEENSEVVTRSPLEDVFLRI